jgi:ubiquinone/menaquinone biosynthesis C-methylase UbiE
LPVSARSFARRLVDANVELSARTERRFRLPSDKPLWRRFEREAGERIASLDDGATVLDLGGGRRCVYAAQVKPSQQITLVAVDVSSEELALNTEADETRVADIAQNLPFADASVDLVLSRMLLEHVDGVPAAAHNMARVLKPGGTALHLLPARYALFAMAARLLPFGMLLSALHRVVPATQGQVEFEVFYDHGHPDAMEQAFRCAGFSEVEIETVWGQPGYFEWCFPLFLLHGLYARVCEALDVRRLASYMLVRATR